MPVVEALQGAVMETVGVSAVRQKVASLRVTNRSVRLSKAISQKVTSRSVRLSMATSLKPNLASLRSFNP